MVIIGIFGLLIMLAYALWLYCIVVQLENISQQLCWMRETLEKKNADQTPER